jgi:hypothetical protein
MEKFHGRGWKVCCVTHPLMQNPEVADVTIMPRKSAGGEEIGAEFRMKGRGTIVEQLSRLARSGNDQQMLDVFVELNQKLLRFSRANEEVTRQDLIGMGLKAGNERFMGQFFRKQGSRASMNVSLC